MISRLLCLLFGHRPNWSHPSMVLEGDRVWWLYRCRWCDEVAKTSDRLIIAL